MSHLPSFGNQIHDPIRVGQRVLSQVVVVGLPGDSRVLTPPPHPAQPHAARCFAVFHYPTPIVIDVVILKVMRRSRASTGEPPLSAVSGLTESRVSLAAFPARDPEKLTLPPLRSACLRDRFQRYYSAIRLPASHLPFSPLRLGGHTRCLHDGSSYRFKNLWVSLVALKTWCVARMGLRLRVFSRRSP